MAIRVSIAGATANHLTLDIQERQVLIRLEIAASNYEHHVLFHRVYSEGGLGAARWAEADSELEVSVMNLANEFAIPLWCAREFPVSRRPFSALPGLTVQQLAVLRVQAEQFAEIQDVSVATAPAAGSTDGSAVWLLSDTSYASFALEVSPSTSIFVHTIIGQQMSALLLLGSVAVFLCTTLRRRLAASIESSLVLTSLLALVVASAPQRRFSSPFPLPLSDPVRHPPLVSSRPSRAPGHRSHLWSRRVALRLAAASR